MVSSSWGVLPNIWQSVLKIFSATGCSWQFSEQARSGSKMQGISGVLVDIWRWFLARVLYQNWVYGYKFDAFSGRIRRPDAGPRIIGTKPAVIIEFHEFWPGYESVLTGEFFGVSSEGVILGFIPHPWPLS